MQIDIRDLRRRLGNISQADLALKLGGIDQATVSRLEKRGKAKGAVALLLERLDKETPPTDSVEAAE